MLEPEAHVADEKQTKAPVADPPSTGDGPAEGATAEAGTPDGAVPKPPGPAASSATDVKPASDDVKPTPSSDAKPTRSSDPEQATASPASDDAKAAPSSEREPADSPDSEPPRRRSSDRPGLFDDEAIAYAADAPTAVWDDDSLKDAGLTDLLDARRAQAATKKPAPPRPALAPRRGPSWPMTIGLAAVLAVIAYALIRFLR